MLIDGKNHIIECPYIIHHFGFGSMSPCPKAGQDKKATLFLSIFNNDLIILSIIHLFNIILKTCNEKKVSV